MVATGFEFYGFARRQLQATFDGTPMLFVASERGSVVGVYDLTDPAAPVLKQLLPSGISPEGLAAIPSRNLLVTANEVDLREDGLAPAHVMVYQRAEGTAHGPGVRVLGQRIAALDPRHAQRRP